jgi:hypothetical protein
MFVAFGSPAGGPKATHVDKRTMLPQAQEYLCLTFCLLARQSLFNSVAQRS